MPRIRIQQFRAALACHAVASPLFRGYRQLALRPTLAAAIRTRGWAEWPQAATPAVRA